MAVDALLTNAASGDDRPRELRMQPAGAIGGANEITSVEQLMGEEIKHEPIHRPTLAFHEVVDQAIPIGLIEMEKSTRHIEAKPRQRLAALAFEDAIGIVEDGIEWIHRMPSVAAGGEW